MEKSKNNFLVKSIIFILVVAITCLLFFGLGDDTKTTNQLISFGILVFSELLIFISIVISSLRKDKSADLLSLSILYTLAIIILNYVIKISITKDLIIWNIVLFLIYLIIGLSVSFRKNK